MTQTVSQNPCPSCRAISCRCFYEVHGVPVNSVLLLPTREAAINYPSGDLRIYFCDYCGFIWNDAFDRRLVEYSERYEETQGFSPAFRQWHENLARRLIRDYDLRGKTVLEIGCGKGEFLELLCELGGNRGVGFDPTYIPGRASCGTATHVEFIRDNYSERYAGHRADFVCCKMTLEHISDAFEFVSMVRRSLDCATRTPVFFQVPDVRRILHDAAFWDIYYEHCSYFSVGSLSKVFRRAGFNVRRVCREYDSQYLTIEVDADARTAQQAEAEDDLAELSTLVDGFSAKMESRVRYWKDYLNSSQGRKQRVVLWGSGSKGVAFLTSLKEWTTGIEYVVDINPNRWGSYMPGAGQEIVGPEHLKSYRPDIVIAMNPVYQAEIVVELQALSVETEVITT